MLISDSFEFHAMTRPDSVMLIQEGRSVTYGEAVARAKRVAAALQARGVKKGERVGILGENSIEHIILVMAGSYIGAVTAPLNYRLAPAEIAAIAKDGEMRYLIICDPAMAELKSQLKDHLSADITVLDSMEEAQVDQLEIPDLSESDDVIQLYTSGTTGLPKGVQVTHKNLTALIFSSWMMYLAKPGYGTTEIVVAPLFHIGGLGSLLISALSGSTIILHTNFDPMAVVSDIEKHKVNGLFMVPAMIQAILAMVPNVRERDFSSLSQIAYGAAPISPTLLKQAMEVFQCEFYQVFGMTETTGAVVVMSPEEHRLALESRPDLLKACGRGMAGVDVKICDEAGQELPRGETGEILIRCAMNTRGYWNRPEETAKTIQDGWVHTGDAGMMDEDGFIYIRDRLKDMVVTGGENVYPVEVEKALAEHASILEVAVIGIPDEKYGEALLAVCALKPDCTLELDELVGFCRDKIAGHKIPRHLKLIDALPRNPSGKVLKTVLREPYWAGRERQVG